MSQIKYPHRNSHLPDIFAWVSQCTLLFLRNKKIIIIFCAISSQIGLAVGDIEAIQKTAFLRNKGKQITFIADIERKFPKFFTRRMYSGTEIVRVGVGGGSFWK